MCRVGNILDCMICPFKDVDGCSFDDDLPSLIRNLSLVQLFRKSLVSII